MMSKVLMSQWTDLRSAMPADITAERERARDLGASLYCIDQIKVV